MPATISSFLTQDLGVKIVTSKTLNVTSLDSKKLAAAYQDAVNKDRTIGAFTLVKYVLHTVVTSHNSVTAHL